MLLTPFREGHHTRKQKFLSSFQLWHLTSLPTTTPPTEYEANGLTPHFQVQHRFLKQSLLKLKISNYFKKIWNIQPATKILFVSMR